MKTMKNIMALLLVFVIMVMGMAGCSANKEEAENAASKEEASSEASIEDIMNSARIKEIQEKGVITVATEPYFAPQEFIDPSKSGQDQYVGADMELAKLIADKLGVELEIVPLEFTAVLSAVAEGKYDLAISALAYTPNRAEAMELSKGYYFSDDSNGYGLLIRTADKDKIKGPEDLADRVIITQSGSLQEAMVNAQVPKYKEFKRVSSMDPDAFLAVQEERADAAAVAVENALLYIENNPDCGMMVVEDFRFTLDETLDGTRVGAKKGDTDLIAFVNTVIDEVIESGDYVKWFEEYSAYAKELGV